MIKKNSARKLALMLAFSLISIVFVVMSRRDYEFLTLGEHPLSGMFLVFAFYSGIDAMYLLLLMIVGFSFITHYSTQQNMVSHAQDHILVRTGWLDFFRSQFLQSIKDIWYFPILINLLLALVVHLGAAPVIGSNIDMTLFNYITDNPILAFVFMTLLQVIGWSILNCFCFLFAELIPNKFVYPFTLLAYCVVPVLFVVAIGNLLPGNLKSSPFWNLVFPLQLISPGVIGLITTGDKIGDTWMSIGSVLVQIVCLLALSWFVYRKKVQNG